MIEASRGISTKTKNLDSARGGLDAEEQVSGLRVRPQGGCGISGLQTQYRRRGCEAAVVSVNSLVSPAEMSALAATRHPSPLERLRLRSYDEEADQDPDDGDDNERCNPLLQVVVAELGRAAGRLAF